MPGRELRALSTLLIGVGFFLVAAMLPRGRAQIVGSLRWIYAGAMAMLAYSGFQIARLPYSYNPVPERLVAFHRLFSIRDPLRSRVTGFAFEPSWLGDQLVLLYLPLFLASVWLAYSAFSSRRRRWSVELLLLLIGVVVLFFSFARLAWLAFFLMLGSLLAASLWRRLSGRSPGSELRSSSPTQQRPCARWLVPAVAGLLLTLAGLVGLIWVGAALDTRFAASLSADLDTVFYGRHPWPYALANQLKYGERLMYWIGGFRVFSQHPLLGVGLGNAGFLLPSTVPGFAFTLPEAIDTLHKGAYGVPNTKSLWIRLLAETGIVGFTLFSAWVAAVGALGSPHARTLRARRPDDRPGCTPRRWCYGGRGIQPGYVRLASAVDPAGACGGGCEAHSRVCRGSMMARRAWVAIDPATDPEGRIATSQCAATRHGKRPRRS